MQACVQVFPEKKKGGEAFRSIIECNSLWALLQIIASIFRYVTTWLRVPRSVLKMGIRFFSHISTIRLT